MRLRDLSALLFTALLPCTLAAQTPADIEARGRALYEQGAGLVPVVAGRPRPALAGRMTCAGCHGVDGRGGTEGGAARAPAISWAVLVQSSDARPAYDAPALAVALRSGLSVDGRDLQMPQFDISDAQLTALVGYLQWLDRDAAQGLAPDRIVLGLPVDPTAARAVAAAMASFNAEGGAYGRQVAPGEVVFVDLGPLLDELRPALTAAEDALARFYLANAPDWHIAPRGDSRAPLILRKGDAQAVILPVPASMAWAQASGADLEAARIHAITTLILEEFRHAGRSVTRKNFRDRATRIDLRTALVIQHDPAAR